MSEQWNGKPPNPETDGWHWLQRVGAPEPFPWRWLPATPADPISAWGNGDGRELTVSGAATNWRYLGPCLTPDLAAAVQAEREACAVALDDAAKRLRLRDANERGIPDYMGHSFEADAADAWANLIRARGETSALDAAIKAARARLWNTVFGVLAKHLSKSPAIETCAAEFRAIRAGIEEAKGDGAK